MDTCEYTSEVMKRVGGGDESGAEVGGEFGVGAEGEPNSTKRLNENSAQESAREELTYVTLFLEHFHDINGQDCRFNLERIGATVESTRSGTILGSDTARVIEWRGRLPVDQYLSACGE